MVCVQLTTKAIVEWVRYTNSIGLSKLEYTVTLNTVTLLTDNADAIFDAWMES